MLKSYISMTFQKVKITPVPEDLHSQDLELVLKHILTKIS
jgi:hypothetical protein